MTSFVLGLSALLLIGVKLLMPTPLDEYGYYYENSMGIYTSYGRESGVTVVGIPTKLKDADPHDFEIVHVELGPFFEDSFVPKYAYAKSGGNIYYNYTKIDDADTESFEHLGGSYAKDNKNIYHKGDILDNVDYGSFKYLGDSFGSDYFGYYYRSFPVLKEKGKETYSSFNPEHAKVMTNEEGVVFIRDLSGTYKIEEQIKVKEMDNVYYQAKFSDPKAMSAFATRNMTVYSTYVLY